MVETTSLSETNAGQTQPRDDGIAAHYETHLLPLTEEFEVKRVEARAKSRSRIPGACLFVAVVAVLAGLTFYADWFDDFIFPAFMVGGAGFLAYIYVKLPIDDYTDDMRATIYPRIFSFFGDHYTYNRDCPWSVASLEESDLFPYFERETLEDHVRGAYKDVPIEMVEAHLTKETGTNKNKRTVTVFDGVLFLLKPRKAFSGKIVVRRDGGTIANTVRGFFKDRFQALETVHLEDPVFEKQFQVYATDQVEARRVLTTSFMQRLLDLASVLGSGKVDCSFFSDRLLIRVETRHDFFAPSSPHEPVDFRKDFRTIVEEMRAVFAIIDTLKLDQDIGL